MAASVPSTVAMLAESAARRRLTPAACRIAPSANSSTYQRIDQPPQTVTSREALKE